jgi:hypothetical protein
MANEIYSAVTIEFETTDQAEAFANKFGSCENTGMELYKYLGFDDYPMRDQALDTGGAKWFYLNELPDSWDNKVNMSVMSAWYIPNNLFETIAQQEKCSITGYAEDEYRNSWTLFEFNQDFDDYEVYDSFLADDTASEFVSWLEEKGMDLDKLYEDAQDPMTFEEMTGGELIREFLVKHQGWSELFFHEMPAEFTYTFEDLRLIREDIEAR